MVQDRSWDRLSLDGVSTRAYRWNAEFWVDDWRARGVFVPALEALSGHLCQVQPRLFTPNPPEMAEAWEIQTTALFLSDQCLDVLVLVHSPVATHILEQLAVQCAKIVQHVNAAGDAPPRPAT